MARASKYAIVGVLLLGFFSSVPIRSALLSLHAAPDLTPRERRSSQMWPLSPTRDGSSLLDRLIRRPRPMAGTQNGLSGSGLRFDGVDDRVTFGPAPALGSATFSLETWIMREGSGKTAITGASPSPFISAVPLITKGVAESDGSNKDANYFFGIDGATQVL